MSEQTLYEKILQYLESVGYKKQSSHWDRNTLERGSVTYVSYPAFDGGQRMEYVVNDHDVWQIGCLYQNGGITITHAVKSDFSIGLLDMGDDSKKGLHSKKEIIAFHDVFIGNVESVEDVERLLKQVGAAHD